MSSGLERLFGKWTKDFAPESGDLASLVRDRLVFRSAEAGKTADPRDRVEIDSPRDHSDQMPMKIDDGRMKT